jgi:hypothetical protein
MHSARDRRGPAVAWTILVATVLLGVPVGVLALQGADTGFVEVCKVGTGPTVGGVFRFTVGGITTDVPVGACSPAIQVPAGTVTVTEVERVGISVSDVRSLPEARLVSTDLGNRSAVIRVVAGDVSAQTTVTFTNKAEIALLKICKVAGDGVEVGTDVSFTAGTVTLSVPAGPPPGGSCGVAGWFPVATHVAVTESIPTGNEVAAITVAPTDRIVGPANLAGGSVVVRIASGVTEATFTNRVPVVPATTTTVAPTAATTTTIAPAGVTTTQPVGTTTTLAVAGSSTTTPGAPTTTTSAPPGAAPTTTTPPAVGATTTTPPGGATTTIPGGVTTTTSPPGGATTTTIPDGAATTSTVGPTTSVAPGAPVTTAPPAGFTSTTVCVDTSATTVPPTGVPSTTTPGGSVTSTTAPGATTTIPSAGSPTTTVAAAPTSTMRPSVCIPAPSPPRSAALLVGGPGGPPSPGVASPGTASPLAKTGRASGQLLLLAGAALLVGALLVRPEPAMAWAALRPWFEAMAGRIPWGRWAPVRLGDDPLSPGAGDANRDDFQDEFPALTFVPVVVAEPADHRPPDAAAGGHP